MSVAYWLGWFVLIVTAGALAGGASAAVTAIWVGLGLVLCCCALVADRWRRREFHLPVVGQATVADRRTVIQLRIQRSLAIVGGLLAVILLYIGAQETDAGRAEIAGLRATGVATVGKVVDRNPSGGGSSTTTTR